MTKEWRVHCKACGEDIGYSDYSYQSMRDYGHSRPEYCDKCREAHQREKETMGISYFSLVPKEGTSILDIQPGALGMVEHPERQHVATEKPSRFDQANFGITPQEIEEIYKWFQDPRHRVVVVVGPTGSGKSTALPYWLMEPPENLEIPSDYFTRDGQILVTQPRIPAAEGVAKYTGETLVGGTVGKGFDVGYRHSQDRNYDWRNRMFQATDGSLINWIQQGKLSSLSVIIIDEAHERSLNIDTILKLLKEQLPLYPHLKIIIASATIDADMFADYFGRHTATIVELEGKDIEYQTVFASEDEKLPYENLSRMQDCIVPATVGKATWLLEEMVDGKRKDKDGNVLWGDILVFLHGIEPIEDTAEQIRKEVQKDKRLADKVDVYTLYADLPGKEKEFIQEKDDPSRIRVIVSTNVAETSLTVEGVVFVVDSGLEYQAQWDSEVSVTEIVPVMISQANAKQRWGRSGRTKNGEVHCLYTRNQFQNLMPEHPTPDIQRLSMETVILNAEAAGAEEVTSGWIQNPRKEEIQRATRVLKQKGALDKDGTITEYGSILRYFSYATPLADLIMLADRWGCVVEVATLLPVIKNGGQRHFLEWDYHWKPQRKKDVWEAQKALMAGCHDDLEFILKVYTLWSRPPGTEDLTDDAELETAREEWAKEHNIRYETLEKINQERENLLQNLYGRRRKTTYRAINFQRLDKLRVLFAYRLGMDQEQLITEAGIDYEFDPTQKPKHDSVTTHRMLFLPEWNREKPLKELLASDFSPLALGKWLNCLEPTSRENPRNKHVRSRLLIDQKFPLGMRVKCQVTEKENGSFGVVFSEAKGELTITDKEPKPGEHIVAEVQGYDFDPNFRPIVLLEAVPEVAPLTTFINSHKERDEVKVKVTGHTNYVGDSEVTLILEEAESEVELLLTPKNLNFTYTSTMAKRIPVGAKFPVTVRNIDKGDQRIEVTCLKRSRQALDQQFQESTPDEDGYKTTAEVVDIWENEQVFFLLDWSKAQEGILLAVKVGGRGLCKPAEEFQLGERYQLHINPKRKQLARTELSSLPKTVRNCLDTNKDQNLIWSQGQLEFEGRMTFEQFLKYKSLGGGTQWHHAIETLFRNSNQLWVTKMVDLGWLKDTSKKYPPGRLVSEAIIKEKHDFGMIVEIEEDVEGFTPQSKIFESDKQLEVGSRITAQVMKASPERRNLVLDMKIEENNPYKTGQSYYGTVVGLESYGAFVQLEPGVDGLLHVSEIPGYIEHAKESYSEGERVHVKILKRGEKGISLGIA